MKHEYTNCFFNVSGEHGFLPVSPPIDLPERYLILKTINKCLLNINETINELPDYTEQVKTETDIFTIQSIFKHYAFLTSAYLLIDVHLGNSKKAKTFLPRKISVPFVIVANKLGVYPWLDYHYAYSLGNYKLKDINKGLHWTNLEMGCSFTNSPDEIGFIMNHVYINELSPNLVKGILQVINDKNYSGLDLVLSTITEMNNRRKEMWIASNPTNYIKFRTFIMGIKGNTEMFNDGVVYEGVKLSSNNSLEFCFDGSETRLLFRGQTGAQDDIIPTLDIFTGIAKYYPKNKLTEYLLDLRSYRPGCVQEFFTDLLLNNEHLIEIFKNGNNKLVTKLLKIVEQVYYFRNGHWQFVQRYIMANTKMNVATGGTPITSWIPNQIESVLFYMSEMMKLIGANDYPEIFEKYPKMVKLLNSQLQELKNVNYNVETIYQLNGEFQEK
jgi:indoleamine 2,3-dioxygenase